MATVKSVNLSLQPAATSDQVTVVVNYTFNFTKAEAKKTFRATVKLWADDTGESPIKPVLLVPLYTFHFGLFNNVKDYFDVVAPADGGDMSGTKTAVVAASTLDEDPAIDLVLTKKKLLQADEIYATVSLLPVGPEQSARSATQTIEL